MNTAKTVQQNSRILSGDPKRQASSVERANISDEQSQPVGVRGYRAHQVRGEV